MAISLTNAGARITATAAATAVAMASGTTTAEAQALGALLTVLGQRQDLALPPVMLVAPSLGVSIVQPG